MYQLTRTRHPFARLFEDAFGAPETNTNSWVPALDVVENADAYVVRVDLPGVDPKDVEISFEDGRLFVRGEKATVDKKEGDGWHRIERSAGKFERIVGVGDAVDTERVAAEAEHGVLTVTLPKRAEVKPRKIDVKVR